ncbi:unnamed protein product [Meloidogyne enterolobii]|uniref:Uncharacterized protein n=1 Tax=Meloidogyne enterolobii TaxID=390850 RepID=A0ACB0Y5Q8_MELEN
MVDVRCVMKSKAPIIGPDIVQETIRILFCLMTLLLPQEMKFVIYSVLTGLIYEFILFPFLFKFEKISVKIW